MVKKSEVIPTFTLKSVDYKNLIQKYKNGDFLTYKKTNLKPIFFEGKITTPCIAKPISKNKESGVYMENFRNAPSIIYVSSNKKKKEYLVEQREDGTPIGRCSNPSCKKDIVGNSIGYPVKYLRKEKNIDDKVAVVHFFVTRDEFCNYKCALHFLYEFKDSEFIKKEPNMSDSIFLLKNMYEINYPDSEPLTLKNDLKIMESNGGTVSEEDFEKYSYIKVPNIVTIQDSEHYYKV